MLTLVIENKHTVSDMVSYLHQSFKLDGVACFSGDIRYVNTSQ